MGIILKILIVSPVFWPEAFRVNDVAKHLVVEGHKVEVLAGHPNYPEGRYFPGYTIWGPWSENWEGSRITRFPQIPRGRGSVLRLAMQYSSFVMFGSLRILMRAPWDWDVIFVFQTSPVTAALPAILARKLSTARAVVWVQDLWPESVEAVGIQFPPLLKKVLREVSSWIYRRFDQVLGQSDAFLVKLKDLGVESSRLQCVPQWADEVSGGASGAIESAWDDGFIILFAGNLGRAQGLETVLKAAEFSRDITNLRWVLMGDGVLKSWLEEEVVRRGLQGQVLIPGRRPPEEMSTHYARADVLLVALGRDEALACTIPGKLQASLAAGKPILGAVDGEAARVILEAGAGWVAPAGDAVRLAEEVRRISKLPAEELAKVGGRARAYYSAYFSMGAGMAKILRAFNPQSTPIR